MALVVDVKKFLGAGNFGTVFLGSLGDEPIAAKSGPCSNAEARILKLCDHRNVIGSHGVLQSEGTYYLIMDLAPEGSLSTHLEKNKFSLRAKKALIQQICSGLDHIHARSIVHRDLRPVNLLLKNIDEPYIVIGDFGEARVFIEGRNEPNTHDIVEDDVYTFASDVYLLGFVAYQIIRDEPNCCSYPSLYRIIRRSDFTFDISIQAQWRQTILDSLDTDPQARPTAIEFRDAFSH